MNMPRFFTILTLSTALMFPVSTFAAASTSPAQHASSTRAQNEKMKADNAIAKRLSDLDALLVKISDMKYVSSLFSQHMQTLVQTEESNLNDLKTKIDTEASTTALTSEVSSITSSFRIYALVMPQVHIAAVADRVKNIGAMLSAVADKVTTRVTTAATSSVANVQDAIADLKSKVADASAQADQAISITAPLKPDNNDSTTLKANNEALKQARGYLSIAQQDIQAARKDLATVMKGLGQTNLSTTTATSTKH